MERTHNHSNGSHSLTDTPNLVQRNIADNDWLSSQVKEALRRVQGGEELAKYFGIGVDEPAQPEEEAEAGGRLLEKLCEPNADPNEFLTELNQHVAGMACDQQALRDLRHAFKS